MYDDLLGPDIPMNNPCKEVLKEKDESEEYYEEGCDGMCDGGNCNDGCDCEGGSDCTQDEDDSWAAS